MPSTVSECVTPSSPTSLLDQHSMNRYIPKFFCHFDDNLTANFDLPLKELLHIVSLIQIFIWQEFRPSSESFAIYQYYHVRPFPYCHPLLMKLPSVRPQSLPLVSPGSDNHHHNHRPSTMSTPETVYPSPESTSASLVESEHEKPVINPRPRPQCWEHGCNGREFSTFSNLLRHQRERAGTVTKAECPNCGAVFTRTTARNIHVGKCKRAGGSISNIH